MLYRRGEMWWYKFRFAGQVFRESAKTKSKELARRAERKRRTTLEETYNGLAVERRVPKLFTVVADEWLEVKRPVLAPKSYSVEEYSLKHLRPVFGQRLLTDINVAAIARYVGVRRNEGAADKSIKLELGTLRGILKRAKLWGALADDDLLPRLRDRDDVGRAISADEERALLAACRVSRSRGLYTAVVTALNTGMRETEIRTLRWQQVDFDARTVIVGKSKTAAGTGRAIPMNDRLTLALRAWANGFPSHRPDHYVFAAERYGKPGAAKPGTYAPDPTQPIGSWKTAWKNARKAAGLCVDSTTSATARSRGCWKRAYRSRLSRVY